ncbi:hypothetical protein [Marinagarivorans algicola]|uniref:hypothetical protein n=1 Tax=Marinagarivorans algicola TaxID=1513270 RepID=UPI0006B9716F|nr:hypothetical protein [Marinagarivorans algicola]
MFKKILCMLFSLCFSWVAMSGGDEAFDSLKNKDQVITLDWARGTIQGKGIDISWNIHSCDVGTSFKCLIIEGFGVELAYPINPEVGDSWDFDGRRYRLAMSSDGNREMLIVSRFNDVVMNSKDGPNKNRINLIKVINQRLVEYVSYDESSMFEEVVRWESVDALGLKLSTESSVSKAFKVDERTIKKCVKAEANNCLGR